MNLRDYLYGSNSTDPSTLEPTNNINEQKQERAAFDVSEGTEYYLDGSIHRFGIGEPTIEARYEYYKELCKENEIPEADVKSIEDFTEDYNSDHFTLARRLFAYGPAIRPIKTNSFSKFTDTSANHNPTGNFNPVYSSRKLNDSQSGKVNIDSIMAGIERAEKITQVIKEGVEVVTGIKNDPNVFRIIELAAKLGLDSDNIKVSEPEAPGNLSGYDYTSSPAEVTFKTNISNHAYTKDFEAPEEFRPILHVTSVALRLPVLGRTYEFFDRLITFLLQNKFQSNVNFNVSLTKLSRDKLYNAYNYVLEGLAYYYYFESILAFTNLPSNKHDGMLDLRGGFDAEIVYTLRDVKRILDGTPIPPNMINMAKYLFQTFRANSTGTSALLKLAPYAFTGGSSPSVGLLKGTIQKLTQDDIRETFSLISRAMPEWRDSRLTDSPATAIHDAGFTTLFANLPFSVWDGNSDFIKGPNHSFDAEERPYGTLTDDLDGAWLALSSSYDTTESAFNAGFLTPRYTIDLGNRVSYGKIGSTKGWYSPFNNRSVALSRGEINIVYQSLDNVGYTSIIPATFEGVYGVSVNSTNESSIMLLEHLFETDSIQAKRTVSREGAKSRKPRRKSFNNKKGPNPDDEVSSSPRDEL